MDIISYVKARKAGEKADSVQEQLNQAVQDGDQLAETQQARVDEKGNPHSTLKERLDSEQVETDRKLGNLTTQLAETVKKNEGGSVSPMMLTEETLSLVTGEGTINLESIPQDGSVSVDKFSPDIKYKMEALLSALVVEGEEWGSQ